MFSKSDYHFMQRAYELAEQAAKENEVPVGAVLVLDNEIIAESYNQPIKLHDPTAHAEILVIREAAKKLENYRLINSTLYVTLEPCPMCTAAMVHARIKKLIYATDDLRTGAIKSVFHLANHAQLNHRIQCESGLLAEECEHLLKSFFQQRRNPS